MTDETKNRLELLKEYARANDIEFGPNIGEEALEKRIKEVEAERAALEAADNDDGTNEAPAAQNAPVSDAKKPLTRAQLKAEQTKLVRVRITCMNPNKKDLEGEIITVSNGLVGTLKKYIPFNAEEGWHVPQIMLNVLREREFQMFYQTKDERGNKVTRGKQAREFAIEVLPPLTEEEIKELAQRQAMVGSVK